MTDISTITNRLKKNKKARKSLLKSEKTNCYRLYEKDIPEYPYIIDIYQDKAVIYEKGKKISDDDSQMKRLQKEHFAQIEIALVQVMGLQHKNIHFKTREKQKGKEQYTKNKFSHDFFEVHENDMKFRVNLNNYLDTGVFLDHRPLRKWLKNDSQGKKVLNLFSYTGSISVAAALGGANVTTVDMSKTYLDWAVENFKLNKINPGAHDFIQADVIQFIEHELNEEFDTIILDPPSFSNSKRMEDIFEVQRDHSKMVHHLMKVLKPGGTLYFSNNFRKFKIDPQLLEDYSVKDITLKSIPKDFRDLKIHVCFEITHK